jgi:uncharacterized membrane protein YphA (DoxX/SURF4 family)
MGLLLLRTAAGVALITAAIPALLLDSAAPSFYRWILPLTALASGASLLLGFLTPIGSVVATLLCAGILVSWLPQSGPIAFNARSTVLLVGVMAAAVGFLGPGAFSVDCRLFGRREIVIPQFTRSPKP